VACGSAKESSYVVAMRGLCSLFLVAIIAAGCASPAPKAVPEPTVVLPPPSPRPPPKIAPSPRPSPKPPPVKEEPPAPPPLLSSQVGGEEEAKLRQQAEVRIEGAESTAGRIDERRLATDQQEIFLTIRSFLSKAREALAIKDFSRAFTLADKARILAEELLTTLR